MLFFQILKEVFLEFVMEECGSNATPELMDAWDKLLTFHNICSKEKSEGLLYPSSINLR